jgi:predicted transcriptional regulator
MTQSREKFHPTTKRDVIEMLERMSDDVSLEDMMYALYVRQRIDAGLRDIAEGRTVSQEQVEKDLAEWLQFDGPETPAET